MLVFLLTKLMVAIESHMNSYGVEDFHHMLALGHCAHCRERGGEREGGGEGGGEKDGGKGERGGTGKEYYITTELWLYGQPLLTV